MKLLYRLPASRPQRSTKDLTVSKWGCSGNLFNCSKRFRFQLFSGFSDVHSVFHLASVLLFCMCFTVHSNRIVFTMFTRLAHVDPILYTRPPFLVFTTSMPKFSEGLDELIS